MNFILNAIDRMLTFSISVVSVLVTFGIIIFGLLLFSIAIVGCLELAFDVVTYLIQ